MTEEELNIHFLKTCTLPEGSSYIGIQFTPEDWEKFRQEVLSHLKKGATMHGVDFHGFHIGAVFSSEHIVAGFCVKTTDKLKEWIQRNPAERRLIQLERQS